MKLIKIYAVSMLASVFALNGIAQEAEEKDKTTSSSESKTKLDTAQAESVEVAIPDITFETIDDVVESMVDATVSLFHLTFAGTDSAFDEAIAEMEKTWSAKVEEFDTDKNGTLSLTELKNVPEEEWADDFKALSAEERDEALKSQFKELDTNEDGEVSTEEVVKLVEKQVETFNEVIKSIELSPSTESDEDATNSVE
ncbi:MAG: EF-hand domain-containing protein [Gammaproteobacteria bacterium]|nr:EF-hand domain-containing protein [Gammaproteobacteria bacterium]